MSTKSSNPRDDLTEEQIADFRDAFKLFDRDSDGNITIQELETVLRSLGQTPTKDSLAVMIKKVDADGNGEIDFDEFLNMMASKMMSTTEDEITQIFQVFDRNQDGFIEPAELMQVMHSLGEELTAKQIRAMINELDDGGVGMVAFDAFNQMASGGKN
eukprot:TRINITY_DN10100_c0_g1_i1.p1 TRINITY_DN10100_c0_g1~~TRINITY_DN10100_c0_g1_i1.p1  ORF type:complete len:158 (+),score=46.94 TRINITY_DN10100_c0_g1_i1:47-520(+)